MGSKPRIVAMGGGTGLSTLLRGLKQYTHKITAIVTVTDDGGSSGRIRSEMGMLPPGDIRNCLVALADAEPLMTQLFDYRFNGDGPLSGHSFGNLFIAAMCGITGNFNTAVQESSKVLSVRGRVLPATLDQCVLGAVLEDGRTVMGETTVSHSGSKIKRVFLSSKDCAPLSEAVEAIGEADAIVLGPGSLYTSVLPNLLVAGLSEAIMNSSAAKIYICNVMTQPGETDGYSASDHLQAVMDHAGDGIVDWIIVNNSPISREMAEKYERKGASLVSYERARLERLGVEVVEAHVLNEANLVRHDPVRLAEQVVQIASGGRFSGN